MSIAQFFCHSSEKIQLDAVAQGYLKGVSSLDWVSQLKLCRDCVDRTLLEHAWPSAVSSDMR